jgi:hypothetical protein
MLDLEALFEQTEAYLVSATGRVELANSAGSERLAFDRASLLADLSQSLAERKNAATTYSSFIRCACAADRSSF